MTFAETSGRPAALEEAAAELEEAAWREGIDRDGILGPFVMAMRKVLVRLAEIQVRHERVVAANIEAARQLTEAEAQQLKEILRGASLALQQARSAEVQLEIQRETIVAGLVAHLGPQLSDGIKHWQVIKERESHRRAARRRAIATALVAMGLVLSGYVARSWQDQGATRALERCLTAAQIDPATHQASCTIGDLLRP